MSSTFISFSHRQLHSSTQRAALELLRFNKRATPADSTPSSSSAIATQPARASIPSQSRDATLSSRYFPSTPQSHGTVLIPNSSPLNLSPAYHSYHQNHPPSNHDMASSSLWGDARRPFNTDPLSVPTGFMTEDSTLHVSSPHLWGVNEWHHESMTDEGPPRKRINYGQHLPHIVNSPGSPQVQPPGQRRRKANGTDRLSTSSDESISDIQSIISGPSRPRIVRGHRPDSYSSSFTEPTTQSEGDDPKFTRFLVTMPLHSPSRVRTAWNQAHGDVKQATVLLSDPAWDPEPSLPIQEATGRVKEIDDVTKAERAAAREKGKKSMIYARNRLFHASTPPPTTVAIDLTALSPITPITTEPRRRRIMKMVIDSESELELTNGEEINDNGPRKELSDDSRALEYFNTTAPEALQELTGTTKSSLPCS